MIDAKLDYYSSVDIENADKIRSNSYVDERFKNRSMSQENIDEILFTNHP
jgi:hypothetical protein